MEMIYSKKGFFFTIMALILVSIFLVSFTTHSETSLKKGMFSVEARVDTMDSFIEGVEQDLQRGLHIAGFRALLAIEDEIIANGVFLDDYKTAIREVVLNGTLDGTALGVAADSSLSDWADRIGLEAQKINVLVDYSIEDFDVYHINPWEIKLDMNITLFIDDTAGIASWQRPVVINTTLNVAGFEDPLYIVGAFGKASRIINATPVTSWDIGSLEDHLDAGTYRAYSGAPSFLMRLEGDMSASSYGIETLVDTNELNQLEIPVRDASSVDYLYWGSGGVSNSRISGITDVYMPAFKLDAEHVSDFNVGNYSY